MGFNSLPSYTAIFIAKLWQNIITFKINYRCSDCKNTSNWFKKNKKNHTLIKFIVKLRWQRQNNMYGWCWTRKVIILLDNLIQKIKRYLKILNRLQITYLKSGIIPNHNKNLRIICNYIPINHALDVS